MQNQLPQKLELKKEQELGIYFSVARPLPIHIAGEQGIFTLAYSEEEAYLKCKEYVKQNNMPIITSVVPFGGVFVENLLKDINIKQASRIKPIEFIPPKEQKELTKQSKEQFINSLKLYKDDFISNKKDKKSLEGIIERANETTKNKIRKKSVKVL